MIIKTFFLIAVVNLLTFNAYAEQYLVGSYELYDQSNYQPTGFCDVGVEVVLDYAATKGKIVFLKNFVNGICDLAVSPAQRFYSLTPKPVMGKTDTSIYQGQRQTKTGVVTIEIQIRSHQPSTGSLKNSPAISLQVTEIQQTPTQKKTLVLYTPTLVKAQYLKLPHSFKTCSPGQYLLFDESNDQVEKNSTELKAKTQLILDCSYQKGTVAFLQQDSVTGNSDNKAIFPSERFYQVSLKNNNAKEMITYHGKQFFQFGLATIEIQRQIEKKSALERVRVIETIANQTRMSKNF
jgi:hypothetical protein